MTDSQRLIDPSDLRKYRHELPNIIDDMGLSPYAYRLYGHIKRRCGGSDGGMCYEGARKMAEVCKMSVGMIVKAKVELLEAGLILIKPGNPKTNTADTITIVDVWVENFRRYQTCSSGEQGCSSGEHPCSPRERKKEPREERTIEELKQGDGSNGQKRRSTPSLPDEDFLDLLQAKPAYATLDVRHVFEKMSVWCEAKGKQPTRMRLINWLNKEDRPMNGGSHGRNGRPQAGAGGNNSNGGGGGARRDQKLAELRRQSEEVTFDWTPSAADDAGSGYKARSH